MDFFLNNQPLGLKMNKPLSFKLKHLKEELNNLLIKNKPLEKKDINSNINDILHGRYE